VKKTLKPYDLLTDFITGKSLPNIGSEENRQQIERFLVEKKGFDKTDIEVDSDIHLTIDGDDYRSHIDLVVSVEGTRTMAIKSAAGSLDSWKREIISAARLLARHQLPVAVVSDGTTAIVIDTITGTDIGFGMEAIPSKEKVQTLINRSGLHPLSQERLRKEMLIFRTYDMMNVNVSRNL
jgi:hypothetical protein